MKIGIFDSGLGGLILARAIKKSMPEYDYVYLGDTKRVPYGNRSYETVFEFTKQAVDFLFRKENCAIVIVACNTASARALRRIQQEYLIKNFPDRKVLGVLIPTAEECGKFKSVGVLGTNGTIDSNTFPEEIKKVNLKINSPICITKVFQNSAPILVPLAEEGEKVLAKPFLVKYLKPLLNKKPEAIALGCTHYPFFKNEIRKITGSKVKVISQDELIPKKLKNYFMRHPEIEKQLSKKRTTKILFTDMTKNVANLTEKWFGKNTKSEVVEI
ncbi:MAG TPA: glutamate racemase [Candidatus Paceibacterota bacterium]|nr:glutamate racemase [Candidatus Paceibacterota bacterium]HPT18028.1 glutamate racemase [Candidatus Paceibacterota bacterium]